MELLRLIDDELAVGRIDVDLGPLERTGGRALEVDARAVVAAAVAGALELVLRREPVRRTPEVGTHGDERVHDLLGAHDPDAVLLFPALVDLADGVVGGLAGLELLDRLEEDVREHEPAEDAGQAAEGGGERRPRRGQHQRKAPAGDLPLLADLRRGAPGQGSFRGYLIWRDFVRHSLMGAAF